MSLIVEMMEQEEQMMMEALDSILIIFPELKSVKNVTVKTNITQMMSAIVVFACIKKITIKEAMHTIQTIGDEEENWPTLDTPKGTKFRIGNNTLTTKEFDLLKDNQWLNDRVSIA